VRYKVVPRLNSVPHH